MDKYVIDLHEFSKKLCSLMVKKGMVYNGNKPDPIALYNAMHKNDQIIIKNMIGFRRSDYTQKIRPQINWINGENYPKRISDILELCNALDCDLDYLFTDMQCQTHDVQFIHDYTGLSEDAINKLEYHNRQMHHYIESLNILLSSANFGNALYYINKYIKAVKLTDGFAKIRRERYEKVLSNPPDCGDAYNWPYSDNLDEMYTKSLHEEELSEYNIDTYFRFVIKELARLAGRNV